MSDLAQSSYTAHTQLTASLDHTNVFTDSTKYIVTDTKIGSGSFADIFLATGVDGNAAFAAKVFRQMSSGPQYRSNIEKEILTLQKIASSDFQLRNVLRFEGAVADGEKIIILTELLHGGDLLDKILEREESFNEIKASRCLRNLVEALHDLHNQCHIIHRDVKIENMVFVDKTPDSNCKLVDFGFAVQLPSLECVHGGCYDSVWMGSPTYLAPEIILRKQYSSKSDVWSAGVTAYVLLSGKSPFEREDDPQNPKENRLALLRRIVRGDYIPFESEYWEGISSDAIDLIMKMLRPDPEERICTTEILQHPWIQSHHSRSQSSVVSQDATEAVFGNAYISRLRNMASKKKFRECVNLIVCAKRFQKRKMESFIQAHHLKVTLDRENAIITPTHHSRNESIVEEEGVAGAEGSTDFVSDLPTHPLPLTSHGITSSTNNALVDILPRISADMCYSNTSGEKMHDTCVDSTTVGSTRSQRIVAYESHILNSPSPQSFDFCPSRLKSLSKIFAEESLKSAVTGSPSRPHPGYDGAALSSSSPPSKRIRSDRSDNGRYVRASPKIQTQTGVMGEPLDDRISRSSTLSFHLNYEGFERVMNRANLSFLAQPHVFRLFDADNSGTVDYREFLAALSHFRGGGADEGDSGEYTSVGSARMYFDVFDVDGSGTISVEEFKLTMVGMLIDKKRQLVGSSHAGDLLLGGDLSSLLLLPQTSPTAASVTSPPPVAALVQSSSSSSEYSNCNESAASPLDTEIWRLSQVDNTESDARHSSLVMGDDGAAVFVPPPSPSPLPLSPSPHASTPSLGEVVTSYQPIATVVDSLEALFNSIDLDGDGMISYEEFKSWVESDSQPLVTFIAALVEFT